MRCLVVALVGLGLAPPALGADLGILRGSLLPSVGYRNWEGFYVGGDVGVGAGGASFGNEGSSLIGNMVANTFRESDGVQNWATGGNADTGHNAQYGGFIGYNAQWGDVVIGLEANYHHTNLSADSSSRTPSDGSYVLLQDPVTGNYLPTAVSGTSSINLTDFGTVRARFGWAVDRFLPYLTGGVALGRASYATTATLITNPSQPSSSQWPNHTETSATDGKSNALIYGWSAGLGMDIALTSNIFVRGEYEYIQFGQMKLNLNSARVGAGVRF